jgi:hypothetical protein
MVLSIMSRRLTITLLEGGFLCKKYYSRLLRGGEGRGLV